MKGIKKCATQSLSTPPERTPRFVSPSGPTFDGRRLPLISFSLSFSFLAFSRFLYPNSINSSRQKPYPPFPQFLQFFGTKVSNSSITWIKLKVAMHRLPGIFAHKKRVDSKQKQRGESSVKTAKPRLQRLNAKKNIDYEPSMLDFNCDDNKSFRIEGKKADEFLDFFEKLGFSGPDDFAIPADEWDAMIVRSSSAEVNNYSDSNDVSEGCAKAIQLQIDKHVVDATSNGSCCGGSGAIVKENICGYSGIGKASDVIQLQIQSVKLNDDGAGVVCSASVISDAVSNGNEHVSLLGGGGGGGGIRGLRPPFLAPPPVMSLPIVDDACSTWDIFKAFGPEDCTGLGIVGNGICRSEVVDGDEECIKNEEDEENSTRRILGVNSLLSVSSSFTTTSNDDDSSSSTTERMSIISPNGRFARFITRWDKGELLGRGSFGSVYEGISE